MHIIIIVNGLTHLKQTIFNINGIRIKYISKYKIFRFINMFVSVAVAMYAPNFI